MHRGKQWKQFWSIRENIFAWPLSSVFCFSCHFQMLRKPTYIKQSTKSFTIASALLHNPRTLLYSWCAKKAGRVLIPISLMGTGNLDEDLNFAKIPWQRLSRKSDIFFPSVMLLPRVLNNGIWNNDPLGISQTRRTRWSFPHRRKPPLEIFFSRLTRSPMPETIIPLVLLTHEPVFTTLSSPKGIVNGVEKNLHMEAFQQHHWEFILQSANATNYLCRC